MIEKLVMQNVTVSLIQRVCRKKRKQYDRSNSYSTSNFRKHGYDPSFISWRHVYDKWINEKHLKIHDIILVRVVHQRGECHGKSKDCCTGYAKIDDLQLLRLCRQSFTFIQQSRLVLLFSVVCF